MTQPVNTSPAASGDGHLGELTTAAAIALLLAHAGDALTLEHAAADAAARPVRVAARDVTRWATRQWVIRFGSLSATPDPVALSTLRSDVVRQIRADTPDPAPDVLRYAQRALAMGTRQATVALNEPAVAVDPLSEATVALAARTTDTVVSRYATAEQLLTTMPITTHADLVTATAPLHAAARDVDRDARTAVNRAVNEGAQNVAAAHGADLLWFAEPDACVVCLALAGTVVGHDEDFPISATFGNRPTEWWTPQGTTLLRPPRHPRCRCRVEAWYGHAGPPGSLSLPEALKREAQRSVLRGWSLPSESEGVRVDAAERLLARGTNLPKTVQAVAREAVRAGRFKTRKVPVG